jgi:hypothetical protein
MSIITTRIFLAHATEDKDQVRELYSRLKAVGLDPWLDEIDLLPGQNWQVEIPKAIRASKMFIACLSKRSVLKEGYVQKEFRLALSSYAEKPPGTTYLIPLRLDACKVPELAIPDLGVNLHHIQWLDYWKSDGFEKLTTAIRQCDSQTWSAKVIHLKDAVRRKKDLGAAPHRRNTAASNVIRINGDITGSIVANTVHVSSRRSPRVNYPVGCVGANLHKKNYVAYLIARYFMYRDADSSYGATRPFSHAEIHRTIESKFKVKTYFVPETLFGKECDYVKQRIDKTVVGKNNLSRGIRNYESFGEFLSKQE